MVSRFSGTNIGNYFKTKTMAKKEFTAIVFFDTGEAPHKYRGITNPKSLEAYCIRKLVGAWYINYYNKESKDFSHRCYIKNLEQ